MNPCIATRVAMKMAGWKKKFNLSMNALLLSTGLCERTSRNITGNTTGKG
ncbi:hypothetical protein [uncultured Veillonella sp.]|nr:hypothetical protein [uncultured Veillonella sp.]